MSSIRRRANGGARGSHRVYGRRARWLLGVLVGIGVWSIVVTPALVGGGVAQALPSTSQPRLTFNRLIRTSPFQSSASSLRDNEGSAYVARDNSLWLASDNDNALFEVNRTTGALRRRIPQRAFINARRVGGGPRAGDARTQDLEALAYNARADVLYAFSGSTSGPDRLPLDPGRPASAPGPVLAAAAVGVDRRGVAGGRRSHLCRGRIDHPNL